MSAGKMANDARTTVQALQASTTRSSEPGRANTYVLVIFRNTKQSKRTTEPMVFTASGVTEHLPRVMDDTMPAVIEALRENFSWFEEVRGQRGIVCVMTSPITSLVNDLGIN